MTSRGHRDMRDDELLRQYLLGGLSGDEKDRLEERLLEEGALFELAEAVTDEILDDYSQGLLSPAERIWVERRHLSSSAGRSRLAVIQGLGKIAEEERTARILPWPIRDLSQFQMRAAALAAMLLIGVGSAYLLRQRAQLPAQQAVNQPQEASQAAPAPPAPSPASVLPISAQPDKLAEVETPPVSAPSPAPLVLELALGTVMRGESGLDELVVPARTERIELQLLLATGDAGYASYEATLIDTATGSEVLRAPGLAMRESGDDAVLVLHLKGNQLQEGIYAIQVQGVTADDEIVDLADHEFRVHTKVK
jgi:hypothetical protein